jgi:thiol-disulfide isomerase/thioredoxin
MSGKAFAFNPPWTCPPQRVPHLIMRLALVSMLSCSVPISVARAERVFNQQASKKVPCEKAKLLFFTAPWCAPCHRIEPFLTKLCRQNKAAVQMVIVDYDEAPFMVKDFAVENIPTMILLDRSGNLLVRVNGASREGLEALSAEIRRLPGLKK